MIRVKTSIRTILSCALATLSVSLSHAQGLDIPVISDDPSVVISTLQCGLKMYYVPDNSARNMLSMALVQVPDSTMQEDGLAQLARASMNAAAFHDLPFERFLSRNGILPRRQGYFTVDDKIVYYLDSISLSRGKEVLDSALFGVFRIAGNGAAKGIPTNSQALVVTGDVKYDFLMGRVDLLSLECPRIKGEVHVKKYLWDEPQPGTWQIKLETRNVSKIVAEWRDRRIPDQYMKTVLPEISRKMSGEFGWVLKNRLFPEFRRQGIYVWMDYRFKGSADSSGDEVSSLVVYCANTVAEDVVETIGEELDRLFTHGVEEEEYCCCRDAYRYSVFRKEAPFVKNADKELKKCISHFLYGSSLATGTEMMKFEFREMPDTMQTRLFNNYMRKRLSACCEADTSLARAQVTIPRDSVKKLLAAYVPAVPAKLPKDKEEHFCAGRRWNFQSGPVVVHKKILPGGLVHYCYAVKGGSRWADPDYLNCIDGLSSEALSFFLASIGAKMEVKITPACVYFTGSVPEENFDTMVNVLAAISMQKENAGVFSQDRYKIFVTAGPMLYENVRKTLAKYAAAFGAGTDVAVGVDLSDISDFISPESSAMRLPPYALSVKFPLDLSSRNYALSTLARIVLRDRVGLALSSSGATARINCGYESYPEESYRITIVPSDESAAALLVPVLEDLAGTPIDKAALGKYIAVAKDSFYSFKSTPGFYIDWVVNRYVDFKDLYSDFDVQVGKISAADLNAFFTAALENVD